MTRLCSKPVPKIQQNRFPDKFNLPVHFTVLVADTIMLTITRRHKNNVRNTSNRLLSRERYISSCFYSMSWTHSPKIKITITKMNHYKFNSTRNSWTCLPWSPQMSATMGLRDTATQTIQWKPWPGKGKIQLKLVSHSTYHNLHF